MKEKIKRGKLLHYLWEKKSIILMFCGILSKEQKIVICKAISTQVM